MQKDAFKVRITEPTVVVLPSGERKHAQPKEEHLLLADDVHNLIAGGKAVLVEGELPNSLKGTPGKAAARI